MPTPEQWRQYMEERNKYRYGKPSIEPERVLGRQLVDTTIKHINRPDSGERNTYPANYAFGAAAPTADQGSFLPPAATPGREWESLDAKWGIKRPEAGSLPNIESVIRPAPVQLEADTTPKLTSLGGGYGVAGAGSNRTYYDQSGNVVASTQPIANMRGGFAAAATDEQAAKALQDRAEQNKIAQFNIANMNRAAEAERDLRATRLGISRDVLDRMEGRDAGTTAAAQSTTYDGFDPLAMPGDSFQDTRARQAKYDQAMEQALTGNAREQKGAAAALAVLNDLREKNIAAQIAERKAETGINPVDMNKFLLDQQKFAYQQGVDKSKFLLDQEKFNYQQGLDKRRLTLDEREMQGKQASRDLERQKYTDEARKAFVSEYYFPDENAPQAQIAADIFEMSQATGGSVPPSVVARFYEQAVKELGIDYGKGGPKDPTKLNEKVMAMITKAYQEK